MDGSSGAPGPGGGRPASAGAQERPGASLQHAAQWAEERADQTCAASAVCVAGGSAGGALQHLAASPAVLHLNVVASEAVRIHFLPPHSHRPGTAPPAAPAARCGSSGNSAPARGVQQADAAPDVCQGEPRQQHPAGEVEQPCGWQQQQLEHDGAAQVVSAGAAAEEREDPLWQGCLEGQEEAWSLNLEDAGATAPPTQQQWQQQQQQQQQSPDQPQPQRPALTTAGPGRRPPTPSAAQQPQAAPAQLQHADEAVAAERGARLAAEAEAAQLAAHLEDQQRLWQERAAELQGQLRVAQSAQQALQGKVAGLQAELAAEQARRQAAEQQAEAARQSEAQLLARLAEVEHQREHQRQERQQLAEVQPSAGGGARSESAGVPDAAQLHGMLLQLQQEVAALRIHQAAQQALPAPPPAAATAAVQDGSGGQAGLPETSAGLPAATMPAAPARLAPSTWQEEVQGWQHTPPGWQPPVHTQQLPSLASREQQAAGAASGRGPARPGGVTQQRLAEVRSWLQQQEQEQQQQQQQQDPGYLQAQEQRLYSLQQPAGLHPLQQPSPQRAASPTRVRTALHEPRSPPSARPGSARRRLLQGRGGSGAGLSGTSQSGAALTSTGQSGRGLVPLQPPARWDYRPAWNEGPGRSSASFHSASHTIRPLPRVDDLPMARARQAEAGSAAASQAGAAQHEAAVQGQQAEQPWQLAQQQVVHTGEQQQQQQRPWQHEQQAPHAGQQAGSIPAALPAFFPAPPPGVGSPPGMLIHQYFAAPSSPPPGALPAFGQSHEVHGSCGGAHAAPPDPASRPASAGSYGLQYQLLMHQAPLQGPPAWQHQPWQYQPWQYQPWQYQPWQDQAWQHQPQGQPAQQPEAPQRPQQQQQQRPPTPAAGLGGRAQEHTPTAGSEACQPRAPSLRPRSASVKDKPLAVPPTQVDADALAAARAEYVREKERIRAKRLCELADSPGFSLY